MTPRHYEALPWIIIFITALLVLAFLSWLGWDGWSDLREARGEPLQTSVYDRKLNRLDRQGVEAAYRSRVALLFQNWMTDTNKESQDRALRGHRNARKIYIEVMTGIDARDPPTEDDLK
jgi:hypothetical protein